MPMSDKGRRDVLTSKEEDLVRKITRIEDQEEKPYLMVLIRAISRACVETQQEKTRKHNIKHQQI